ncbi:unnamed protein product [Protopolystoma xenopodis]|uniref:Uncharacterized protein n=1 Tax=Protopolystoma xenopodis TaxID=117903 RepID=A0A3S5BTZ1_9PLAT|nr:unnamed protein product [Protopolystoma xenopodis]
MSTTVSSAIAKHSRPQTTSALCKTNPKSTLGASSAVATCSTDTINATTSTLHTTLDPFVRSTSAETFPASVQRVELPSQGHLPSACNKQPVSLVSSTESADVLVMQHIEQPDDTVTEQKDDQVIIALACLSTFSGFSLLGQRILLCEFVDNAVSIESLISQLQSECLPDLSLATPDTSASMNQRSSVDSEANSNADVPASTSMTVDDEALAVARPGCPNLSVFTTSLPPPADTGWMTALAHWTEHHPLVLSYFYSLRGLLSEEAFHQSSDLPAKLSERQVESDRMEERLLAAWQHLATRAADRHHRLVQVRV